MRILEITITIVLLLAFITLLVPAFKKNSLPFYLSLVAGFLIPIHLIIERFRWQMVPISVFTVMFIIISFFQLKVQKEFLISNKFLRVFSLIFSFLLFILCLIFPLLLPVVDLPEPDGPYDVGRTSFRLIDNQREEIFTEDPNDSRNLLITVWYPANANENNPVNYWDEQGITGRAYSINSGMGSFWYSHLSLVETNSIQEAPVASTEQEFPVIIYSHSFYGLNTENTMLMEELASQGYVVFSIAHTYENIVSVYPDGEAVYGYLDHFFEQFDANSDQEQQLYNQYNETEDASDKRDILKQILVVDEESNRMIKTRTEDALFVLDEILRLNNDEGKFKSKLDLNNVGIFGWSFGGATAKEACLADPRFKAGINIDGWPYGELFHTAELISQPFMMIRSETDDEMENMIGDLVLEKTKSGLVVNIEGAWHLNFWDFPLFFKIYKELGYWGTIEPLRLLEINKTYIHGFFEHHLKGKNAFSPNELSTYYPEVTVNTK